MTQAQDKPPKSPEDAKQEILQTFSFSRGTMANKCYLVHSIISGASASDQPRLLRYASEIFDDVDSSEEVTIDVFIADDEITSYKQRFSKVVDAFIESLIAENPTDDDFYTRMWEFLSNPLFRDHKARAFALYWMLIDRKIPYFQVESGLRMSNPDFLRLKDQYRNDIKKVIFILAREFEQRTEKADVLAKHILDDKSNERRVILMEAVLAYHRIELQRLRQATG